jgi:lantibiotic transport system permease protein
MTVHTTSPTALAARPPAVSQHRFARAFLAEFAKMRRLRMAPVAAALVAVVAGMTSISLFATRHGRPSGDVLLMSYVLIAAMVTPLLVAVLASRQVDIEHTGGGWNLTGGLGISTGALCRVKLAAIAAVLAIIVAAQTGLIVMAGSLAGASSQFNVGRWLGYACCLYGVSVAFAAGQVWLATVFENQLIGLGIGLLGSFIAVYCELLPPELAQLVPWGYFAVISPVGIVDQATIPVTPAYGWLLGFWILVGAAFTAATSRIEVK